MCQPAHLTTCTGCKYARRQKTSKYRTHPTGCSQSHVTLQIRDRLPSAWHALLKASPGVHTMFSGRLLTSTTSMTPNTPAPCRGPRAPAGGSNQYHVTDIHRALYNTIRTVNTRTHSMPKPSFEVSKTTPSIPCRNQHPRTNKCKPTVHLLLACSRVSGASPPGHMICEIGYILESGVRIRMPRLLVQPRRLLHSGPGGVEAICHLRVHVHRRFRPVHMHDILVPVRMVVPPCSMTPKVACIIWELSMNDTSPTPSRCSPFVIHIHEPNTGKKAQVKRKG